MNARSKYRTWSKEDYEYVLKNYATQTIQELASHFACEFSQITSIIFNFRREGFNLPSKSRNGVKKKIFDDLKQEYPELVKQQ